MAKRRKSSKSPGRRKSKSGLSLPKLSIPKIKGKHLGHNLLMLATHLIPIWTALWFFHLSAFLPAFKAWDGAAPVRVDKFIVGLWALGYAVGFILLHRAHHKQLGHLIFGKTAMTNAIWVLHAAYIQGNNQFTFVTGLLHLVLLQLAVHHLEHVAWLKRDRGAAKLFSYLKHAVDIFYWVPATYGLLRVHPTYMKRLVAFHPLFNIARVLPFHTERVLFGLSYLYLISVFLIIYKSSGSIKKFAKDYKLAIQVMGVVMLLRGLVHGHYRSIADIFYALFASSLYLCHIGEHLYSHY
jgi:hypothetical protein